MAREVSEERYMEEMPSCLRELFAQTCRPEQQKCSANNAHSSTKSFKSILTFNGIEFPAPLLTEDERAEMRQYRREAVKCEAKMFERRRERYSNLLLQVMSVMDRVQEERENTTVADTQYNTERTERTLSRENDETESRSFHRNPVQPPSYEPDYNTRYAWASSSNGRNTRQEQPSKSYIAWAENNHYTSHSSRTNSQLSYLPVSVESSFATSVDQSGMYKHQLPRNGDSRQQVRSAPVGFEGADKPLSSTLNKEALEFKRPFSQLSLASNGMFDPAESTMQNSSVSFPLDRNVLESDSLASTSLSMAFSDSSTSTVRSTIEVQPRSSTQQKQHHMDSATKNFHHKGCKDKQALQSEEKPRSSIIKARPVSTKQKPAKPKVSSSTLSKAAAPAISEEDKTLANLEKMRQKLLEEKQKQLDALKQQELQRLRKQKKEQKVDSEHTYASFHSSSFEHVTERPRSNSLPSTRQSDVNYSHSEESENGHVSDRPSGNHHISRTSPLRRPLSMPPGEMYSILELSGENLDVDIHNDNNVEPESSSDKENNVVENILRRSRNDAVLEGAPSRANIGQNVHPYPKRKELKHSVPVEENKLFASNGFDKFAKLSACAKGFLTRRLMKSDKVQGLVKTIKDTRDVLADISSEDVQTVQEKKLKENVEGHLRIAQGGLHDVFFKVPVKERMSYIAHSRAIARAKETKRRVTRSSSAQSKLSAVTLRAIQRRQEDNTVTQTANSEVKPKAENREEKKKKTWNIRVLKPQQGHTSPPLPDRTRSKKHNTRPTTAPEKPLNSRLKKEDTLKRPKTTESALKNPERPSRLSLGGDKQPASQQQPAKKRPTRQSLGAAQQPKVTAKPRAQKRLSLPANAQPKMTTISEVPVQRPKTSSEVKRSSRALAANFAN